MPVSDRILATKLLAPRIGARLIGRERLIGLFDGYWERKLTLVTAPPGYGKSVMVSQFTGNLDCPVVWYHLDSFDNDLAVFIQYLSAGVARHLPGFGAETVSLAERGGDSQTLLRRLVTTVINDLSAGLKQNLIIVFDDYHVIEEPVIHRFVQELLEYLPDLIHVVIAGRTVPPLPLARLKVAEMIVEINQEDLRFSRGEIAEYLVAEYEQPVPVPIIAAVEEETKGWPAALRLARPALDEMVSRKTACAGGSLRHQKEIYYYLASEVLADLSPETSLFIQETSILDVLTPTVCDRFLERSGSLEMLEHLEASNLFIVALEGVEHSYRYHHLFRDFLQSRLGERKKSLLLKAGQCYLQDGSPGLAVEYFLKAGDYSEAILVIEKVGAETLRRGRWQTLQRWLDGLPLVLCQNNPWTLLLQGALDIMHGRLDQAQLLLDQAEAVFKEKACTEGLLQSQLHKARILRSRGNYRCSVNLLAEALPVLVRRPVMHWSDICLEHASGLTLLGELESAAVLLNDALAAAEREGESGIVAHLAEKLGELYYFKGEYARAVEVHQRAVEMAPDPQRLTYSIRDNIAIIYRDWGDLDQALEYARKSIETKESLGLVEALPYAYHQLAIIQADLGLIDEAEQHFRTAISLARETGSEAFFFTLSTALYGRLLCLLGRFDEARAMVDQAVETARSQSEFIYGICLEVAAPVYSQTGNGEEALQMLHEAIAILEKIGAKFSLCIACGVLAQISYTRDDLPTAHQYATRCLQLAASENYLQLFSTYCETMLPVLRMGLEDGCEYDFVRDVLGRLGSQAVQMLVELAGCEDPEVRGRVALPLAKAGGEAAEQAVAALLGDPVESVRDCALAAAQQYMQGQAPLDEAAVKPRSPGAQICQGVLANEARLEVFCLGTFRAEAGGKELSWRTTKARDLFAFLIHHRNRPVTREAILDQLWPESDPEHSTTLLHTNLYQLRKALKAALGEHNLVKHASGQYRLDEAPLICDLVRFEERIQSCPGQPQEEEKTRLEEAIALYRGDYMESFDYPWIEAERERLNRLYLAALDRLAKIYSETGEHPRAVSCLRAVLRSNPLLEEIHARLMIEYARIGDRMAVMQQYETLTQVLEDELGIDPGPATRELYYRLCSEEL